MDIAGAIGHGKHLSGLGLVGGDGIVARYLAMMRVVAPARPLHLQTRAHHRAIHIDGQALEFGLTDHRTGQRLVELPEPLQRAGIKTAQPTSNGARRGHLLQTATAQHHRILTKKSDMAHSPPATDDQRHDQHHHGGRAVVAAGQVAPSMASNPFDQIKLGKILAQQLQSCERGQALALIAKRQFSVDSTPQIGFFILHWQWPFVVVVGLVGTPNIPRREAFFVSRSVSYWD